MPKMAESRQSAGKLPHKDRRFLPNLEGALLPRLASPLHSASLFTGLFVVRMLFELPQQTALLQLHVEALQGAVD